MAKIVDVQFVKVERAEVEPQWPWRRREFFTSRGVPENLLYQWVAAGDVRAKKTDLETRHAATFFRVSDVLEMLESLPDVKTKAQKEMANA